MNMKTLMATVAIATLPLAASALTIDDFNVDQPAPNTDAGGNSVLTDITIGGQVDGAAFDGGGLYSWDSRQLFVDLIDGPQIEGATDSASIGIYGGELRYESSSDVDSAAGVLYSFSGGYDLSGQDAFSLLGSFDQDYIIDVTVTSSDGQSSVFDKGSESEPGVGLQTYVLPFAGFVSDGSEEADFADITSIMFRFGTNCGDIDGCDFGLVSDSLDFRIDVISAIPVPAGAFLMGTALAGFGAIRRKKKKAS